MGRTRIDYPQAFFPWCVTRIHSCSFGSMNWTQDLWISECSTLIARTRCIHKLSSCRWLINLRASLLPQTEERACETVGYVCQWWACIRGVKTHLPYLHLFPVVCITREPLSRHSATEPSFNVSEEGRRRSPTERGCLLLSAWRAEPTREEIWVLLT